MPNTKHRRAESQEAAACKAKINRWMGNGPRAITCEQPSLLRAFAIRVLALLFGITIYSAHQTKNVRQCKRMERNHKFLFKYCHIWATFFQFHNARWWWRRMTTSSGEENARKKLNKQKKEQKQLADGKYTRYSRAHTFNFAVNGIFLSERVFLFFPIAHEFIVLARARAHLRGRNWLIRPRQLEIVFKRKII